MPLIYAPANPAIAITWRRYWSRRGMPQEAFKQLREVYDEPVAHYDLGFLLNKRGMRAAALQEFTIALRFSPGMAPARQWVERLSGERDQSSHAALETMPRPGQGPAAITPNRFYQPPQVPPPPMAPLPPQFVSPPPYVAPPYSSSVPLMAQGPCPLPAPPPAGVQYPAQGPSPVPPQTAGPQYAPQLSGLQTAGPQNPPQYQASPLPPPVWRDWQASGAGANPPPPAALAPVVALRNPPAAGVGAVPPLATDGNILRRLPPVSDPRDQADPNRPEQGSDLVAPDPPGLRR